MSQFDILLSIVLDLTSASTAEARYERLLQSLKRVIPYEAATLLRLEGEVLVPVAAHGLSPDARGRRFPLGDHPRLEIICRSREPVHFPADTALPDPFDGLLADDSGATHAIHACLGCPLYVGNELVGALTADARRPSAFDDVDLRFLAAVGALAAAEMRTTDLIQVLEQTAERQGLITSDLMRDLELREGCDLIGVTPLMAKLRREIALVARSDLTVLITGETGVGKELVARAVHTASDRRRRPLFYVNCAALPETLAESELFGHMRGAFTGASADRPGKFEVADGGTLFLDEIGELPLSVQPKLLRALQEGEIQRVGRDRPVKVDVRVLAATNRDLGEEVKVGRFRADLFHRLCVYPLPVPPLRDRPQDIPLLAGYFCDCSRRRLGSGPLRLTAEAKQALSRYPWPGNVRELENVISRAALRAAAGVPRGEPLILEPEHLGPEFEAEPGPLASSVELTSPLGHLTSTHAQSLRELVMGFERRTLERTLAECRGNAAAAARALGMHRSNFHHLAKRLGLRSGR